jgi:DNA-binding transcriptional ArsR family regulator
VPWPRSDDVVTRLFLAAFSTLAIEPPELRADVQSIHRTTYARPEDRAKTALPANRSTKSHRLSGLLTVKTSQIILNHMVDNSAYADILNHMVKDSSRSLDRVFHALAHPARRAMLRRLAGGERNLSELASPFRMSFPAASKHVRVLKRARLVRRRVVGRTHLCRLEAEPLGHANDFLEKYRRFWEESFERLDDLLEQLKTDEPKPGRTRR